MATDPTTPTPEVLREDAKRWRLLAEHSRADGIEHFAVRELRAARALEEQAARMEAPERECRWTESKTGNPHSMVTGCHNIVARDPRFVAYCSHCGGKVRLIAEGE